jgi:hypothetical protein
LWDDEWRKEKEKGGAGYEAITCFKALDVSEKYLPKYVCH